MRGWRELVILIGFFGCGESAAPTVVSTTPAAETTDVDPDATIRVIFSTDMDEDTIDASTFTLQHAGLPVPGQVSYQAESRTATFTPAVRLSLLSSYDATVTAEIRDAGGTPLAADHAWSFVVRDGVWETAALLPIDAASNAEWPQVALDDGGNAVAVWRQSDGNRWSIWASQYLGATGWSTARLLETDDAGDARWPQIAMDGAGNAVVVWSQSSGTSTSNVWAARLTGSGWESAELLETDDVADATEPQVAVDGAGNAVVVWSQCVDYSCVLQANRFVPPTGWTGAEQVGEGCGWHHRVGLDASGNGLAVWSDCGGPINVRASRFVAGAGWGPAELLELDDAGDAAFPELAVDAAGNGATVWTQTDGTLIRVRANHFAPVSGWRGAQVLGSAVAGDAEENPQVAAGPGGAMAVWAQLATTGGNAMWVSQFSADSGWSAAESIAMDNGYLSLPHVAMDAAGNAIAVWVRSRLEGFTVDIHTRRFTASDSRWHAVAALGVSEGACLPGPSLAMNAAGSAVSVWCKSDGVRASWWVSAFR